MLSVGATSLSPPQVAAGRPSIQRETGGADGSADAPTAAPATQLSEEEQRIVAQLKARDREVRAHEQAHKAVGGRYAGAISYEYDRGPDGKAYAVAGEVPIDASPVADNPKATIAKMEIVIAAALAPVEPSAQDRAVARQAQSTKIEAETELRAQRREERFAARPDSLNGILLDRFEDAKRGAPGAETNALEAFRAYAQQIARAPAEIAQFAGVTGGGLRFGGILV
ncbi:MAG: hypothetical protein GC152_12340 [Alphaproteobacteria bacterium]|nr:hypothetical protein [Alphaproteobacteria bacterium]